MADFDSIFDSARHLSTSDQLRLIGAIWAELPAETALPPSDAWSEEVAEIERRVRGIKDGSTQTIPWETVRAEMMERLGQANAH
jgi:putative addiction module component (TIGR02574 family)